MKEVVVVKELSKSFHKRPEHGKLRALIHTFAGLLGFNFELYSKTSDPFWALKGISFSVRKGECLGIIGLNGAGKSTILKILMGRLGTDGGNVEIVGEIGGLIELSAGFNDELSGLENIHNKARSLGVGKFELSQHFEDIVEFAEIGDFINSQVKTYSSGMKMRLGFAIAVHLVRDIVICDEVLAVGDFGFRQKCHAKISQLRKKKTFILVSHSSTDISTLCDRVLVLHQGRSIYEGAADCALKIFYKLKYETTIERSAQIVSETIAEIGVQDKEESVQTTEIRYFEKIDKDLRDSLFFPEYHNKNFIGKVQLEWNLEARENGYYYEPGKPFVIFITYELLQDLRTFRLGVPMFAEDGTMIFGPDTRSILQNRSLLKAGRKRIKLDISQLPMLEGKFWVSVSLSEDPAIYYRKHLGYFQTKNSQGLFGKYQGAFKWEVAEV